MKGVSLRKKTMWVLGATLAILVLFSIVVSYLFYSDAVTSRVNADRTQFFIIFTCAEVLMAIVLLVLGAVYVDLCIVAPLRTLTDAVAATTAEQLGEGSALTKLELHTGDELEELGRALGRLREETAEYVESLKQENWAEEHDHMTMLDNRERFERRVREEYPGRESIYIACMNIINLHIVNERLGDEAGDSILSKVARELRRLAGDRIHAYRLEEDHFMLVFVDYSEKDAVTVMQSWTERVGRLNRASDRFEVRLVWGGAYGSEGFDVMDVYRHADTELYCNKVVRKKELESGV